LTRFHAQGNVARLLHCSFDFVPDRLWFLALCKEQHSRDFLQPIKLLPNGDFLLVISITSATPTPPPSDSQIVMREINLAGDTIREISRDTLNDRIASAGFNLSVQTLHHDVLALPNGHIILIVNSTRDFTDLPGLPGTTTVLGDALVDLDPNLQPVWVWNSFDHLEVNRHPMDFPDWTHSNATLYSPDDGNLLLSMRHQNWIIKIEYQDGKGAGNVLWRLGRGGDFTLQGGIDPTDWFYAQHLPSFVTPNTAGTFSLVLFDNGDDREFPTGASCGSAGGPSCLYSTVPILRIDEAARVASLEFHYVTPQYSNFGGNAESLGNGDIEFDECTVLGAVPNSAAVVEVTRGVDPQIVWQMNIAGTFAYRAMRMPSLYPGVQW
jgi:arylsulfate sulfotransferase